jgi:hypothetical protein
MADNKPNDDGAGSVVCAICPHAADCTKVGACLTTRAVPFLEARQYSRWMLPHQAIAVEAALRAGKSYRQITNGGKKLDPAICSTKKWKNHITAHPIWGAEMNALAAANAKAHDADKGSAKRNLTHCKFGHPLDIVKKWARGHRTWRTCSVCRVANGRRGHLPPAPVIKQVKELLINRTPISRFTHGPGYLLQHKNFTALRQANPEIAKLYAENLPITNSRAQIQRHFLSRLKNGPPAVQNRQYVEISSLVSRYLPGRDDVVQEIFEALLDKSLHPQDVRQRIDRFVTDQNRMFPTKYRKFGNDDLVSLDQVLFEDGSTTRGDTVSRGLWD